MRVKRVLRYDPATGLLRVARVTWDRGRVGDGNGYSSKVSVGLVPRLFRWRRELFGWELTLFGVRLHRVWSYGGRFAD